MTSAESAETIKVNQAFVFALDPTPGQAKSLSSHCGAQRFSYNWAVAAAKANLNQRESERTYDIAEVDLTPSLSWSAYDLRRSWNRSKAGVAPWWAENSKEAYSSGIANAAAALRNWRESRAGRRAGAKVRFPRFHSKRHRLSCRFTTGTIRIEPDRRHVTLPRLGAIRLHENARKLARHLERGTGRILEATISYHRGRWRVSFACEINRALRPVRKPASVIGVDLGLKTLAVLSTGEFIPNPKHLKGSEQRLRLRARRASRRRGPSQLSGEQPSNRWRRANEARNRVLYKVANTRETALHRLTRRLSTEHGTVVIEDLNVAGMLRRRSTAKAVSDAAFGSFRRMLTYKTEWSEATLVVADRWFPSSKTCSACGVVKAKLPLRARVYRCETCGLKIDRDRNAANNLAALVDRQKTVPGTARKPASRLAKRTDAETPQDPRSRGRESMNRQSRTGHRTS
jgi:putative transposase